MASTGGTATVWALGMLALLVAGCCATEQLQPASANLCQPRCWSSERDGRARWPASSSINQYWECLVDGGEWYAHLRSCPLGGMWFDAAEQVCVTGGSTPTGVACNRQLQFADGNELCPEPSCATQELIETLWGYPDPAFFLQCRPVPDGSWRLQLMPCAPGTWFHFRHQVCVIPELWEACDGTEGDDGTGTTPEITTPEITTPEITTPEITTPEITTPEITTPEITTPEITTPEITTPEITTPEITTPEITTPEITTPEITTPEITTPEVTTPEPSTDDVVDDSLDPCSGPRCVTFDEINTLWVHPLPTFFYQCRPLMGGWSPQEMPCAPGTLFSFRHQVCVHPQDWTDPCDSGPSQPPVTPAPPVTPVPPVTPEPPPTVLPPITSTGDSGIPPSAIDCLVPNCALLQDEVLRLPSHDGPQFFYRCIFLLQTVWLPFQDICPNGQYFGFLQQSCVDPSEWLDVCPSDPIVTTQPTTVPTTPTLTPPPLPLPVICGSPRCTTPAERSILWPSTVADMYYRCEWIERLFQYVPMPVRCENFFFFDFQRQECVIPLDWVDICPIFPTLPTPPCTDCCPTCPPPPSDEPPSDGELPVPIICGAPRCVTELERNFLWPAVNPNEYYRCVDNGAGWVQATLEYCPDGELFQTFEQRCVPAADHDNTICPIFPPLPPSGQPDPSVCIDNYDPSAVLPIICDIARCETVAERATIWPANDPTNYFMCSADNTPVVYQCPPGELFHFLSQCCRSGPAPDVTVCPIYPPINTPPPPLPEPALCAPEPIDPTPFIPIECDIPRCDTPLERDTLWPSSEETVYYQCIEQLPGLYEPVQRTCESTAKFNFLLQCCTSDLEPLDVCTIFLEEPPAPETLPLPIVCDQPRCETELERSFYWPAADRKLLYVCEQDGPVGTFAARMYTCADGKAFHVWRQDCVPEQECRLNVCPYYNGTIAGPNTVVPQQTTASLPGSVGPILTPPSVG
uniref:Chitin-binding type-2 domain-containing protein n=1 Tax=Anopheles farauti TaxID=69004 RepID=A0A182Q8F3_9DIPT